MPVHTAIFAAMDKLCAILDAYLWRAKNEDDLQAQIYGVLMEKLESGNAAAREVVIRKGDRIDLLVTINDIKIALEVKIKGSATTVERQAQRYALSGVVDAVIVVTSKRVLAHQLNTRPNEAKTLGGKPFRALALRGAI